MRTDDGQDPFIEPTQPQRRPGAELARAREEAGTSLRAMADTLHLPEKQVRALENDDYANLPPPTFVRGYLRAYARTLGLDAEDIVGLYDTLEVEAEDPALRLYSDHGERAHNRGLVLAIAVLALAVSLSLGAWWWQTRMAESAGGSDAADVQAPAAQDDATSASPEASASDDTAGAATGSDSASGEQDDAMASATADTTESSDSGESNPPPDDNGNGAMRAAGGDDGATRSEGGPAPATEEGSSLTILGDGGGAMPDASTQSSAPTSGTEQDATGDAAVSDDPAESGSRVAGATDGTDVTSTTNSNGAGSGGPTGTDGTDGATNSDTTVATADSAEDDGYQPPSQTSSAEAAVAPEAAEGPEQLQIDVDGRSWIEIYDARGRELVYTLYSGDAPLRLRGWAPFDIFLGNSPDVSIRFNGNPVEKTGFTRSDRTARFLVDASGANQR